MKRIVTGFDDRGETDFLGVADPFIDVVERLSVIEVRGVNYVPGGAQLLREAEEAGRLSLSVVEKQDVSHPAYLTRAAVGTPRASFWPEPPERPDSAPRPGVICITGPGGGRYAP